MDEATVRTALDLLTSSDLQLQGLHSELAAQIRAATTWSRSDMVIGLGVAEKITSGQDTSTLALKVYVDRKLPPRELQPENQVPPVIHLPGTGPPIPTDVEAIGPQSLEPLATRQRPAQSGYSLGSTEPATGTFGALVRRAGSDDLFVLSNAHVLAECGNAAPGLPILQPGPDDGGQDPQDRVAVMVETIKFDFSDGFPNLCDAAIGAVSTSADVSPLVALVGAIRPAAASFKLSRGQVVQKTGRTTGHTTGKIKDVDYRTSIIYPKADGSFGSAGFRNQVLCERYSGSGDSGALILNDAGAAVGLHWCGSTSTSVFSPIEFVLDAFGVELIYQDDLAPDGTVRLRDHHH